MNVASVQNALTTTVWSSNWNPPLQGEPPVPFALQIDAQNQLNQLFNIEVSCDFVFPPNWRNPQNGAGFFKIHLTNQNHISLLIPNQTVDHAPAVPLEAYFFVGPLHDVFSQSFPYAHRLEIIRNSVMDLATYVQTHSTIEYKQAAAKYIAQNIWTILPTHLAYDNIAGKASCGFLSHGGILEMTVVFGAANDTINCYDLAGINQAWCAALGMADNQAPPNGTAVLETRWVYSGDWFGYVTEGPLFGRAVGVPDEEIKCNNPFWGNTGVPWYGPLDLMNTDRRPFRNHAWVEVVMEVGQPRKVLETCHARVDLANLANVTLCQADIDRDDWIAVAVNTGHDTAANVGKWKPIGT
ncbi:hypothetical protein CGMCC3_g14268 [Colletotrichum fructicola]|nr:uncharacterized protein CGMCC3_g14268 [Colletotrichum fructicola]KAE9569689.1 hypothetical protein CGMCC3_g14268 [Colletotrichum fructicola]